MKASDFIIQTLIKHEIKYVFGYQGGMITHLVDSIEKQKDNIQFVQTYHEQSAAFAASGYATATENIGVAMATSGPGATNLITGIADAFYDSIPVIFITGQVNTYESKGNLPIRQLGFQEADIVSMVKPITKFAIQVTQATDLPEILAHAIQVALSGRKGPVLIDIPLDIQRKEVTTIPQKIHIENNDSIDNELVDRVYQLIQNAKSPIFLIGGGAKTHANKELLRSFFKQFAFPLVYSLRGKGIVSDDIYTNLGMIGSYGIRAAHLGISNSDVIIVLGSRLDTRQTGANLSTFCPNANIVHVDIDENELLHHRIKNRITVHGSISIFIEKLLLKLKGYQTPKKWIDFCIELKKNHNQHQELKRLNCNINPYLILENLQDSTDNHTIYIADVGQHQMWAAQMLEIKEQQNFFTSAGFGAMGYAIPYAVGYAFGTQKQTPIVAICGDGGFHIAIQSLMLISQYDLPIRVLVMNNYSLGMITQFQDLYFNQNFAGTKMSGGYIVPNIKYCAAMYNLPYEEIGVTKQVSTILNHKHGVFNVILDDRTFVYPKLEFDKNFNNPSPGLDEKNIPQFL